MKKIIAVSCLLISLGTCAMDQEQLSERESKIRDLAYFNMMYDVSPAEKEKCTKALAAECIAEELQKEKQSGWMLVRSKKWKRALKKDVEDSVDWYEYDYLFAQLR